MKSEIVESEDDFHLGDRLNFPNQANRNQILHCFIMPINISWGVEFFTAAAVMCFLSDILI